MNSNHRFNRDEISKILKRAAELEHTHNVDDDSEGLTEKELEQISKEVGLHPKYIKQAVEELQQPDNLVISNLFGGPFDYYFSNSVPGTFSSEEWEEYVSEIRRIHGGIGKTEKLGNTFEWEQREQEVGYMQISLSPKEEHTKIRINADYSSYASDLYGIVGAVGSVILLMIIAVLFKKAGLPLIPLIIGGGITMLSLLTGVRFYLSYWMRKKRKTYHKLFKRFQEMLNPADHAESSPSIKIPEGTELNSEDQPKSAGRQKTS